MVGFVFPAAAEAGDVDLVRRAIELGCDVNEHGQSRDRPAIYLAARKKHVDVVELLAGEDGINVGQALLAAAFCGLASVAKGLIDRGADVEHQEEEDNDEFGNPLTAAIQGGHVATMCLLLDAGAAEARVDGGTLFCACCSLKVEIVQVLLEQYKADVNATDWGTTALLAVCQGGRNASEGSGDSKRKAEIARLLLEHGANRDVRITTSSFGRSTSSTVLDIATRRGFTLLADVLRDRTIGRR